MNRAYVRICTFGLVAATSAHIANGTTLKVPTAYPTIQAAIDAAASSDTVLVLDGTYRECINLRGKLLTVCSLHGAESTIIDGGSNGTVVTFSAGEGPNTLLKGFTIQNGVASGDYGRGGGVLCDHASPKIQNCIIRSNSVSGPYAQGGGMCFLGSGANVTDCVIIGNSAPGAYADGGGVHCEGPPQVFFTRCSFVGNSASGSYGIGGGLSLFNVGASLSGCVIAGNRADGSVGKGGGVYFNNYYLIGMINTVVTNNTAEYGGGILCYGGASPVLKNCTIADNRALEGAGIGAYDNSSPALTNCVVAGNVATGDGGGLYCKAGCQAQIVNSTFARNQALHGRALLSYLGASPVVLNSILWDASGSPDTNEIFLAAGEVTVRYSLVKDGWPGLGNLNADPRFVATNDFHLATNSPCIDAASSDAPAPPQDLEGNRRYDDPQTPNVGVGANGAYYDLGAFELQNPNPIYVPDQYPTIQAAIEAVPYHGTVIVRDGTYSENLTFSGLPATVRSEHGPAATIIQAIGTGPTVSFQSYNQRESVLDGFTLLKGSVLCSQSSPTLRNCVIRQGSGLHCWWGAAPLIINCQIVDNSSVLYGGGVSLSGADATLVNCVVASNTATMSTSEGGGIYCEGISKLTATSCTISQNTADLGGGVRCALFARALLTNTIVWGNAGGALSADADSAIDAAYSDVQGGWPGPGNLDQPPGFVGAADYHLTQDSPCIDAGTAVGTAFDLAYLARPLDGDNDGVCRFDLGAYEFAHPAADSDHDGLTDAMEAALGTNPVRWDSDGDGVGDGTEVSAGTNPLDPNSFLAFSAISVTPLTGARSVTVSWPSVAGKRYSLLRASSLSATPVFSQTVLSNILATPPFNTATDTNAPTAGPCFYRLRLE